MVPVTLHYRRAVWHIDSGSLSLETLLRDALASRSDVGSRRWQRPDGHTIECSHFADHPNRILVHLLAYKEDDPATLVGLDGQAKESELRVQPPPNDAAFMEGNLAALVSGNHVLFCGRPIREGALYQFTKWLLRESWPIDQTIDRFELHKVADINKITLIRREGVKSFRVHGCLKPENFMRWDRLLGEDFRSKCREILTAMLGEEPTGADNESIDVSIEFDLKKRKIGPTVEKWMKDTAESLLEDMSIDFVIETFSGQRITNEDLIISKRAKLERLGGSFDHKDAWRKLNDFLTSLRESGALEA